MEDHPDFSFDEFQKALTPKNVRVLQIIYGVLGIGVLFFVLLIFFLYATVRGEPNLEMIGYLTTISGLHLVLLAIILPLSRYIPDRFSRYAARAWDTQSGNLKSLTPAEKYLLSFRTSRLFRLALLEGVAFFGLIICYLAVVNMILQAYPVYWLNLISTLIFEVYIIKDFPSREKLEQIFREKQYRMHSG